jgi:hypothetical protein
MENPVIRYREKVLYRTASEMSWEGRLTKMDAKICSVQLLRLFRYLGNKCVNTVTCFGTWQQITWVLGPNEGVHWTNELQKYHTTKCNTHFWNFFYPQLVILGLWLLTWLTWFLSRLTLPIVVCQLALLSFFWPLLIDPLWIYSEHFYLQ